MSSNDWFGCGKWIFFFALKRYIVSGDYRGYSWHKLSDLFNIKGKIDNTLQIPLVFWVRYEAVLADWYLTFDKRSFLSVTTQYTTLPTISMSTFRKVHSHHKFGCLNRILTNWIDLIVATLSVRLPQPEIWLLQPNLVVTTDFTSLQQQNSIGS